jgi:hypothetical protein
MDNKEILPEILESSPEVTGADIRGESDLRVPELTPVGPTTSAASPVLIPGSSAVDDIVTMASSTVAAPSDDDLAAEDVDLIEHEWVARAKKVVAQTIGNPHAQTNELNKVRADYIKKRYNRTIKSKATS